MLVQTIGAWVTIVAVLGGGGWAFWRYRRQKPDLPRVNATIDASLSTANCVDYVSYEVTVTHVAGDSLSIERPGDEKLPKVLVSRLTHASAKGDLPDTTEVEAPVLERDQTLSSGEVIREQGMVSVGERHPDTIAYQVRLIFDGGWEGKVWTWSPNKILPVTDKTLKS